MHSSSDFERKIFGRGAIRQADHSSKKERKYIFQFRTSKHLKPKFPLVVRFCPNAPLITTAMYKVVQRKFAFDFLEYYEDV